MRFGLFGMRFGITLDPDDRKDDDRRGLRRITAEAHDAPLFGKFNNVTHQPLYPLSPLRRVLPRQAEIDIGMIKRHARLTAC